MASRKGTRQPSIAGSVAKDSSWKNSDAIQLAGAQPVQENIFFDANKGEDLRWKEQRCRRIVCAIGISGPSGAGKSTLARALCDQFDSPIMPVQLDWYTKHVRLDSDALQLAATGDTDASQLAATGSAEKTGVPRNVDYNGLMQTVAHIKAVLSTIKALPKSWVLKVGKSEIKILRKPEIQLTAAPIIVLVEGYLLFCDATLLPLMQLHFWLECTKQLCLERLLQRRKKNGGRTQRSEFVKHFDMFTWPAYLRHKDQQLANVEKTKVALDSTADAVQLAAAIRSQWEELHNASVAKQHAGKSSCQEQSHPPPMKHVKKRILKPRARRHRPRPPKGPPPQQSLGPKPPSAAPPIALLQQRDKRKEAKEEEEEAE